MTMLIYLDTNVYSRPFDNQNKPEIRSEADAFMDIVSEIKSEKFTVLCSDILMFEVYNILSEDKRSKVKLYLGLCSQHIDNSDKILNLGQQIGDRCQIRARDALHIASAIIGGARYCLSCDKKVTQMKQSRCYRNLAKPYRQEYFSVMNPVQFINKFKKEGTL